MKKFSILSMILIWSIASFSQTQGVSLSHSTPLTGKAKSKYKIEALNKAFINLCLEANKKELENSDVDPGNESKTGEQKSEELTITIFKKNIADNLSVIAIEDENEKGETKKIARINFTYSSFEYFIEYYAQTKKAITNTISVYKLTKSNNGKDKTATKNKIFEKIVKNNKSPELISDEKETEKFNSLFTSFLEENGFIITTDIEATVTYDKWTITVNISEKKLKEISKNPEDSPKGN
ncbi:MAG: hypothetical protein U9Q98_06500 [Bacteroidota bacterium]|nr:hypothetical protein [Bacteroidota bacterium]